MKALLHRLMRDQRGSQSVGYLLVIPVIGLLLAVMYFAGVTAQGESIVQSAANAAARDASLARDAGTGHAAGVGAANRVLDQRGINCRSRDIDIDSSALNSGVGSVGVVTATISCDLNLADLGVPKLTERKVTATGRSPIDQYRQR